MSALCLSALIMARRHAKLHGHVVLGGRKNTGRCRGSHKCMGRRHTEIGADTEVCPYGGTCIDGPYRGRAHMKYDPAVHRRRSIRLREYNYAQAGAYKSLCVHHGLKWIKQNQPGFVLGKLWQRNYWKHIIRDESELNRIREYIGNNPVQWEVDQLYISPNCPGLANARSEKIRETRAGYATEECMV